MLFIKFSVLLSVYKNENPTYLKEALLSILNQTLKASEILIVKDGSLTPELDLCLNKLKKEYSDIIKILPFDKNRGLGLALHDGVLACKYNYIFRMDTDDIAEKNRFWEQVKFMESHHELALCGTWVKEFSKKPELPETKTQLPCKHEDIVAFAKSRNPFRHMTVLFKKNAVIKAGNYRDFLWFEDYDLWIRMILAGYKTANIPEYLVNVRADEEMFARRGGFKYIKQDIKFQYFMLTSGFIQFWCFIKNVFVRTVVRILPNKLRIYFYKKILRKSV